MKDIGKKTSGRNQRDQKATACRHHVKSQLLDMSFKPSPSKKAKWKMVHVHQLHKSQQGMPKGQLPLPCIDQLVESVAGYKLMSCLDAYSGYQ